MKSVPEPGSHPELTRPPSPGQEDILGARISAALIDLALLVGLFIVVALAIGEATAEGGSVNLSLGEGATAVYFGLVLLYYVALEAAIGQTLGKLLLGLRVVGVEGSRPSVAAVALRTLLRIVDWLPLLYLVGFITMMATGQRRQRLGDLAAKTVVERALPMRRRSLAVPPIAFLLLLLVGLSVYRATDLVGGTKTYRAQGVRFDYPASWGKGTYKEFASAGGEGLARWQSRWEVVFVLDSENVVKFRAWKLRTRVTDENWEAAMEDSKRLSPYVFTIISSTAYAFDCLHGRKDEKATKIDRECDDAQYTFDTDAPQFPSAKAP